MLSDEDEDRVLNRGFTQTANKAKKRVLLSDEETEIDTGTTEDHNDGTFSISLCSKFVLNLKRYHPSTL